MSVRSPTIGRGSCAAVALLAAMSVAQAQVVDFDATFGPAGGLVGRAMIGIDVVSSAKTDKAIAVFPSGADQYLIVGRGSSPAAGNYRIAILVVGGTGTTLPVRVIDDEELVDVRAACVDPNGRVLVAATVEDSPESRGVRLIRFLANGNRDLSFTPLTISALTGAPPLLEPTHISCVDNDHAAIMAVARVLPDVPGVSAALRVTHAPTPSLDTTYYVNTSISDGYFEAAALARTSGGRWLTVAAHDGNDSPPQLKAMTALSGEFPDFPMVTDIPFASTCALSQTERVDAPKVIAAPNNRFHAAGHATNASGEVVYVLSGTVGADGSVSNVSCNTEPSRAPLLTSSYQFSDLLRDAVGDLYVLGTTYPDVLGSARQQLRRYRANATGTYARDPGFAPQGRLTWTFPRRNDNPGPYADTPGGLLLDTRGSGYRMMAFGGAEWVGADDDISLTAFSNTPLFRNGLE